MKREDIAKIVLMILLIVEAFLSLNPGIVSPNSAAWLIALTLLGIGILALKSLLDARPLYQKQYHGAVKLDGIFMMQVFIGVLTTFSYLGMLFYCLINAYIPAYSEIFNKLLTWSIVPGLIWGFFFGQSVAARYVRGRVLEARA